MLMKNDKCKNQFVGYIYKITNTINNKVYIGQTRVGVQQRIRQHFICAVNPKSLGYNTYFYKAIRKYGITSFVFETIFETRSSNLENLLIILDRIELFEIKRYKSNISYFGYNSSEGGRSTRMSKEVCRKMSIARIGAGNNFYGKHHSQKTKELIRNSKFGKKLKPEKIKKKLTKEERGKIISKSLTGKPCPLQKKTNISNSKTKWLYDVTLPDGTIVKNLKCIEAANLLHTDKSSVRSRASRPLKRYNKYIITRHERCLELR